MFKYALVLSALATVGFGADTLLNTCNNADYKGNCVGWVGNLRTCNGFLPDWNDVISSVWVGADKGYVCRLYRDRNCKGEGPLVDAANPITNLQNHNFNDMATSYYCWLS